MVLYLVNSIMALVPKLVLPWYVEAPSTRGVHLIVALRFCKAHYKTYPCFTYFNWLMGAGTVPQFLSPGKLEQVYTCGHMHYYSKAPAS